MLCGPLVVEESLIKFVMNLAFIQRCLLLSRVKRLRCILMMWQMHCQLKIGQPGQVASLTCGEETHFTVSVCSLISITSLQFKGRAADKAVINF